MWPKIVTRYIPLPDHSPPAIKSTLVCRGNILIALSIFGLVIIVGTALTFDFRFAFTSKQPDIVSPEISPLGSPTSTVASPVLYSPAISFSKEHLSMEEIKAMVSQTKGFYTRDYSLGLGWNNVRTFIVFYLILFLSYSRFATS